MLELLKLLGRNPSGSDKLYSSNVWEIIELDKTIIAQCLTYRFLLKGVRILVMAANLNYGKYKETLASMEALKCIANSLLLVSATKDYFEADGGVPACAEILCQSDVSGISRFLAVRILFFATIDRPKIVTSLIDQNQIASGLTEVRCLAE